MQTDFLHVGIRQGPELGTLPLCPLRRNQMCNGTEPGREENPRDSKRWTAERFFMMGVVGFVLLLLLHVLQLWVQR